MGNETEQVSSDQIRKGHAKELGIYLKTITKYLIWVLEQMFYIHHFINIIP